MNDTQCPFNNFVTCIREKCQIWWKCKNPRENTRKIEEKIEDEP